jgi:hypothetical protein
VAENTTFSRMVNPKTTNPRENVRLHDVVSMIGLKSESSSGMCHEYRPNFSGEVYGK